MQVMGLEMGKTVQSKLLVIFVKSVTTSFHDLYVCGMVPPV
jgi:hypothetical protein